MAQTQHNRLRSLTRRMRTIEAQYGQHLSLAELEEREALARSAAFFRAFPGLDIFAHQAALARRYLIARERLEHPEQDAPGYRGARIEGPHYTLQEIVAEWEATTAEIRRLADDWYARGMPEGERK